MTSRERFRGVALEALTLATLALAALGAGGCSVETRSSAAGEVSEALVIEQLRTHLPQIEAVSDEIRGISQEMCLVHCRDTGSTPTISAEFYGLSVRLRALCLLQRDLLRTLDEALREHEQACESRVGSRQKRGACGTGRTLVRDEVSVTREACDLWLQQTRQLLRVVDDYQQAALPVLLELRMRRRRLATYVVLDLPQASELCNSGSGVASEISTGTAQVV